NVGSNTY
nr:Chain A, NVGSNTY heptapeptide segment from Islet Amyloid Polypeptide [Homo sapiens]3FTL_A Chain A, NVGSNTY heptapeptide segment from Islet Amyloid Polypeptide [Homo sapiens]3FTL_B Chain B, NVGSNTY heptapeptide segment from Islet Amyloid Polypeptide [Homo sapiens]